MIGLFNIEPEEVVEAFRGSLVGLIFDLAGLGAGFILFAYLSAVESAAPYLLIFYPSVLSIRGVINGIFSGNLATKLHLGTVKPSFRELTYDFKVLYSTIIGGTLIGSTVVYALNTAAGFAAGLLESQHILNALITVFASMDLSIILVSPITAAVAFFSFKMGFDPDKTVYPVMSTVADILVTLVYTVVIGAVASSRPMRLALALFLAAFTGFQFYIFYYFSDDRDFTRQIRECGIAIAMVSAFTSLSGIFFAQLGRHSGRREIYVVYPAVIDTVGDVGSIVGSVITTRLHLGSKLESGNVILGAWLASVVIFSVFSGVAAAASGSLSLEAFRDNARILLATNFIAVLIIVSLTLGIALVTFKKGLDPDNFVNPVVSTVADTVTTISLYTASILMF
mgnify:CR=1 FL=1